MHHQASVLVYLFIGLLLLGQAPAVRCSTFGKPSFIELATTDLQKYMELAKERHADAIKAAQESYWSGQGEEDGEIDAIQLDKYQLNPPTTWALPDFDDEFANEIKVTLGANGTCAQATPIFSPEECQEVIEAAEKHFEGRDWTRLPSGQYDVAGFWIKSVPSVHQWFNGMVKQRLFPLLQREFPQFASSVSHLVVDNAYVFKYTTETGRRTGIHTDSGCLTFTIALGGNFTGGGTWIEGIGTIEMTQGHATVRPGGVRHCGQAVTSGTRYIIGGFTMHRQKVEYNRMLIGLGSELASNGQFEKAKEALEAAILLNPKFDGAYTHLASVCQQLGQQEKAGQVLEYCLENVNPNNGEVAYTLGMNCFNQGSLDRARQCFELCLDLDDCDADSMMGIAQICRKKEATVEEIKWYERIIATPGVSNEVMASAYSNMGFLKVGQEEEILLLQKALEFAPSNFQLRYSLGSALASRKNWKEASECFRAAAGLAEDPEMEVKTLKLLYRVAMSEVQTSNPNGFASQQEMILALQKTMGLENYSRLASLR